MDALFDLAPDAYLVLSGAQVVRANAAAVELLGTAELTGQPVGALFDDASALLAALDAGAQGRVTGDVGRGGLRFEFALATRVDGATHALILRDVTELRRREQLWERDRLLSQSAHDIVLFIRRDGTLLEANEAAAHAYGYTRDELRRLNIRDLRAPATREVVPVQMREAFDGGVLFETLHIRRDGTTFPVEVSSRAAMLADQQVLVSIIRDLTERNAMQARLLQADRMAAVGTLAAGVAHEINNPLAYALTNLEVLARTLASVRRKLQHQGASADVLHELDTAEQMLGIAREGAGRVRAIVRDLKTFSRADDVRRAAVDVRAVLDSCINMAAAELRHRARLSREYHEVPLVDASESRVAQVFLNLLVNAAQALEPGHVEESEIRIVTRTDEHGAAVIEVIDNGPGIPKELGARIFDPFVTTKPVGEGTGLGLFISREIVTALGGTIEAEAAPDRGTRMRVTLPAAASVASSSSPPRQPRETGRRARILVVDDEDSIGTSLRRALGDELAVVIATSGREALALLEDDRAFDAVLCDVVMPDVDGLAVHRAVAARDPALADRFLFMTGGALTTEARTFLTAMHGRYIEKPFAVDELRALIARRVG